MSDERLSRSVRLQEPSIALGELAKSVGEQTGVSLRVARAWQATRVMVYAPEVPLRDLMTALTEALPMLEWRTLRPAPDAPPEYLLQARRPDPPRLTERTPAQQIQAIRTVLNTARRLVQRPARELMARYRQRAEQLPETERIALQVALVLKDAYPDVLSRDARGYLQEFGKADYEYQRDLYFPLLMRLRDLEWNALAQRGYCIRRLSSLSESAKLRAPFRRYLGKSLQGQAWDDLLLCIYHGAFTSGSEFIIWARPMVRGRVLPRTVAVYAPRGSITTVSLEAGALSVPQELMQEAAQRQQWQRRAPEPPRAWRNLRLPTEPPDWLKAKASWYNHYACFLLECAVVARTPMIGAYFPFSGLPPRMRAFARAYEGARARDAQAIAPLLQVGLYEPREWNGWVVLRHVAPWGARQEDHADDALQRMQPMPPPTGAPFLDAAALRYQAQFIYTGISLLVLPFYPFRLREFALYPSPYHDAFIIGRRATAVSPQVAWEFYLHLTPQQQARLKAGGEVYFQELNGTQQQRFLALLIGEHSPLGWEQETALGDLLLEGLPAHSPPSARLRMERTRTTVREPNRDARRRILQSENQFYALAEYMQNEEAQSHTRERFSERWLLQLRWDNLTVEWELTERTPGIDWLWEEL
ncbi:MAG: hypothetical protein NZM10_01400 [Fimbriimonadales bacterium]|nr:hypothetical protein [Fimbriimonadales bacterium]